MDHRGGHLQPGRAGGGPLRPAQAVPRPGLPGRTGRAAGGGPVRAQPDRGAHSRRGGGAVPRVVQRDCRGGTLSGERAGAGTDGARGRYRVARRAPGIGAGAARLLRQPGLRADRGGPAPGRGPGPTGRAGDLRSHRGHAGPDPQHSHQRQPAHEGQGDPAGTGGLPGRGPQLGQGSPERAEVAEPQVFLLRVQQAPGDALAR